MVEEELTRNEKLLSHVSRLIRYWGPDYDTNRTFYLNQLLPDLQNNISSATNEEKGIIKEIKQCATEEEWLSLKEVFLQVDNNFLIREFVNKKIDSFLKKNDLVGLRKYIESVNSLECQRIYDFKTKTYINHFFELLLSYLNQGKLSKAEEEFNKIQFFCDKKQIELFHFQRNALINKLEKKEFIKEISILINKNEFEKADSLFLMNQLLSRDEYLEIKAHKIKSNIDQKYIQDPDKFISQEQSIALADPSNNILVRARAGSGKTTTLTFKAILLMDHYHILKDEILLLAFNKKASKEITERVCKYISDQSFDSARTFHSLSRRLVHKNSKILFDKDDFDKDDFLEYDAKKLELSKYVEKIMVEKIKSTQYLEKLYLFFKKEITEIEENGLFLNKNEYYQFKKVMLHTTLRGDNVKSRTEKYIADYLFEHDIQYSYEKPEKERKTIIHPTFKIFKERKVICIIDYWDVYKDQLLNVKPNTEECKYKDERYVRQSLYESKSYPNIEFWKNDNEKNRDQFEDKLESMLLEKGISNNKLSQEIIFEKLRTSNNFVTKFSRTFTLFIQKSKKKQYTPLDIEKILKEYIPISERESLFLDLAIDIFKDYEESLKKDDLVDFDDLLALSISEIERTHGECSIKVGIEKPYKIKINSLKWILIDEFQDFSPLFYNLISSIIKVNPTVKLFCVGDDWQAINGFAGSDLTFFINFSKWVDQPTIDNLLTNFRSEKQIVENANSLMNGNGEGGIALPNKTRGKVEFRVMSESNFLLYEESNNQFKILDQDSNGEGSNFVNIKASYYLKTCCELLKTYYLKNGFNKKVFILNRTNRLTGINIRDLNNRIIQYFTDNGYGDHNWDEILSVITVHKAKGLEADLVLLLDANQNKYPLIHPDNVLFNILGYSLVDIIEEERRLFYVGITRPYTQLIIFTEANEESQFVKELPAFKNLSSNNR